MKVVFPDDSVSAHHTMSSRETSGFRAAPGSYLFAVRLRVNRLLLEYQFRQLREVRGQVQKMTANGSCHGTAPLYFS
jgi:hypothetical protein